MATVESPSRVRGMRGRFSEALARTGSVQKTSKGAPAYSRFVNRRMGRYFAAAAYAVDASPNQVTAVSAAFSYASITAVAVARPTALLGVLVALGLVVGYALDSADGQLARLQRSGSPAGEWLDHMVDCGKIAALHAAVLVSFYRFPPVHQREWLLVPLLFGAVAEVFFFGTILTDQLRRAHRGAAGSSAAPEPAPIWRSLLVVPTDYGLMCLAFAVLGAHSLFLAVYAALGAGTALFMLAVSAKWFREIRGFGAVPAQRTGR